MKISTVLIQQKAAGNKRTPAFLVSLLVLTILSLPGFGQDKKAQPAWWFGVAGGANFNFYSGTTSSLNGNIAVSPAFITGRGVGGNVMGLIEFRQPGSFWGLMLLQGADSRVATFKSSGKELKAELGYYTIEPSLVIAPPKANIYFYAGPRLGFLWSTELKYKQPGMPDSKQYMGSLRKNPVSLQVGIGYNIRFTPKTAATQVVLSPFFTYLPSLGDKNLRTTEELKLNTFRAGLILKAGHYSKK